KASKREELAKAAESKAENQMKNNVIEKVFEKNDIDVPDVMVEQEIDSMINEFDQQLRAQGMDLQTYMQYMGQEAGKFREQLKEEAFKKTKTRMIVSKIADQEDFEVSEEEVKEQLEMMAQQYGLEVEKLTEMIGAENIGMITGDIKLKKAVDYMYDNAVIK
ncbi:MAG: trigger factor, partial [Eubacteriales bacterium]|nr:trigger factor [Eubacteriales bacterium]